MPDVVRLIIVSVLVPSVIVGTEVQDVVPCVVGGAVAGVIRSAVVIDVVPAVVWLVWLVWLVVQ